jgi:hypothetical protein
MKTLLLTSALVASTLTSFAQTQIPNSDFENWTTSNYCSEMDSLDNFLSGEAFMYLNTKKSIGTATCPALPFQYQSTDKQSGNYALALGPQYINAQPYYNFATLGKAKDFGSSMGISSEGISFTGRPTKLTGYYKYTAGVAGDELTIEVFGSNLNDEDYLFYGAFTTSVNQTTYKNFEIDLEYDPTDLTNPMALTLLISVGNSDDGSIDGNTLALIDNLLFVYDTPTSTVNYTATSPINVYAVNKYINFSENVSDVHIVDMVGANKMQETGTTKTLNAASLTAGMYIVTYKYNDAYFSKKVVIE